MNISQSVGWCWFETISLSLSTSHTHTLSIAWRIKKVNSIKLKILFRLILFGWLLHFSTPTEPGYLVSKCRTRHWFKHWIWLHFIECTSNKVNCKKTTTISSFEMSAMIKCVALKCYSVSIEMVILSIIDTEHRTWCALKLSLHKHIVQMFNFDYIAWLNAWPFFHITKKEISLKSEYNIENQIHYSHSIKCKYTKANLVTAKLFVHTLY